MEEEAIRVIKSSPRWIAGLQNGHKVNAYKKQPITFVVGQKNNARNQPDLPLSAYLVSPNELHTLTLEDFKKVKEIKLQKIGEANKYELISFMMTIDKEGSKEIFKEIVNQGSKFSDELLKIINDLDSKTFITIEDITVLIEGRRMRLVPLVYSIIPFVTSPD